MNVYKTELRWRKSGSPWDGVILEQRLMRRWLDEGEWIPCEEWHDVPNQLFPKPFAKNEKKSKA